MSPATPAAPPTDNLRIILKAIDAETRDLQDESERASVEIQSAREYHRGRASAFAQIRLSTPTWQPMESMQDDIPQVIVCWSTGRFDTIGKAEYLEILGFGEPPALGWMPLPSAPVRERETPR